MEYKNKVYIEPGLNIDFLLEGMTDRWELTYDCDDADLLIVADEYSHDGIFNIRIGKNLKKYDQGKRVYLCKNEHEAKFYFKAIKY